MSLKALVGSSPTRGTLGWSKKGIIMAETNENTTSLKGRDIEPVQSVEPTEVLNPYPLVVVDVPKVYEKYFTPDYLIFFRLPKVYTEEEYKRIYPKGNPRAKELVDQRVPFMPGVKPGHGMIDIFDSHTNTSASVIGLVNYQSRPTQFRWPRRALEFTPNRTKLPPVYLKFLKKTFGDLRLPKQIKSRLTEQPEYWEEIGEALAEPTKDNLARLRRIFSGTNFSSSYLYGEDKILVAMKTEQTHDAISLELL